MADHEEELTSSFRARPIYRILGIVFALPAIWIGVLAILDHSLKVGIPALGFGLLFLIVGIRGCLLK